MEKSGELQEDKAREAVLVTGATGFLGEYIVRRLVPEYRVLALGRNRERGRFLEELGAEFCRGDFTDRESCAAFFRGVRYVIHAGALSTVWGKWEDFYRTNVTGTAVVARLCHEQGARRLVYISSPSIYSGREDRLDIREEEAPEKNELNYYIRSKLMAEREIMRWQRKGLETVILRPRGLIGVGDTSLVPRLLRANTSIGIPLLRGGSNLVDLTSVENAALACRLAMTAEGAAGGVFNITNGEPARFRMLLEQFLEAVGEKPRYLRLPFAPLYGIAAALEGIWKLFGLSGEPPVTRYTVCTLGFAQTMNISRAEDILGYRPEKTLAQSIREYGQWQRAAAEPPDKAGPERVSDTAPDDGERAITGVTLYHCGFCTCDLGLVFRKRAGERRRFPACAALIRHRELGNLLYDTGYSYNIFGSGFLLRLYRRFLPVSLEPGQTIRERLLQDGISPGSVKHIILSHAHPDHIGGLSGFSGYELTASEEVLKAVRKPGPCSLIRGLLPDRKDAFSCRSPERRLTDHFLCRYFPRVYDLFGDGSVIGVILEGHSRGQMGLWIPDMHLFLAADACWGSDLLKDTCRMRLLPRLVQDSFPAYRDTLRQLCRMKREHPEIRVVFTHQRGRERSYG